MAIVTEEYYNDTYIGEPVATADFPRLDARAEDIIALATHNVSYSNLQAWQQAFYQKAICAQIEYYAIYGIDATVMGLTGESFTVGKVTVNGGSRLPVGRTSMLCDNARMYLEQTGLMNPQVKTLNSSFLPWGY